MRILFADFFLLANDNKVVVFFLYLLNELSVTVRSAPYIPSLGLIWGSVGAQPEVGSHLGLTGVRCLGLIGAHRCQVFGAHRCLGLNRKLGLKRLGLKRKLGQTVCEMIMKDIQTF